MYGKFVEPGFQEKLAKALADPNYAQTILKGGRKLPSWIEQAYSDALTAASAGAPSAYLAQ
jgi:hypothetical protein